MSTDELDRESLQAGEYVLGTLEAEDRKQFQLRIMQSSKLREQTNMWEQRLNEMGTKIKPVKPGRHVLAAIHSKIDSPNTAKNVVEIRRGNWSRSLTGMATAAMFVLAILVAVQPFTDETSAFDTLATAVFQIDDKPLIVVSLSNQELEVVTTPNLPQLELKDYELWAIAEGHDAPISLGVIPQTGVLRLDQPDVMDKLNVLKLAISIEELGGSTTGIPDKVMYVTDLIEV